MKVQSIYLDPGCHITGNINRVLGRCTLTIIGLWLNIYTWLGLATYRQMLPNCYFLIDSIPLTIHQDPCVGSGLGVLKYCKYYFGGFIFWWFRVQIFSWSFNFSRFTNTSGALWMLHHHSDAYFREKRFTAIKLDFLKTCPNHQNVQYKTAKNCSTCAKCAQCTVFVIHVIGFKPRL